MGGCEKQESNEAFSLFLFSTMLDGQTALMQSLSALEIPKTGKLDVVIDTDTYNEIDDQFAVVYALLSPERLNVQAIYAAPFLNSRSVSAEDGMLKSKEEILRLLNRLHRDSKDLVFEGSRAFMSENDNQPLQSPAATDLIDRAMNSNKTLFVITLGAPTNVASAILLEPKIKDKIAVIWLGGKGLGWKTAYEFNLKQDLFASQVLFDSGVPLVQIPTNPVTSHLQTTLPEIEFYLSGQGAIGDYLVEIYKDYFKDHFGRSKVIWDISAVAYLLNEDWFTTEIVHSPILTSEMTYSVDNSRHFIKMTPALSRDKIFADIFEKIQKANK